MTEPTDWNDLCRKRFASHASAVECWDITASIARKSAERMLTRKCNQENLSIVTDLHQVRQELLSDDEGWYIDCQFLAKLQPKR